MSEYFTKIFFPNKVKVAHRVSYSSYNSAWSPMWQTPFSTLIVPIKHLASLITACADYIRKAVIRFFFSQNGAAGPDLLLFCPSEFSLATVEIIMLCDQEH